MLGAQWMKEIEHLIQFCKVQLKFHYNGREHIWQGIKGGNKVVDKNIVKGSAKGQLSLLLCSKEVHSRIVNNNQTIPSEVQEVLSQYPTVINSVTTLLPSRKYDRKIPLVPDAKLVCLRPYKHFYHIKNELEKLIKKMLEAGIIQPSTGEHSSSMVMEREKDGAWRMCVDYRALNNQTLEDKFLIPLIDDLLDELYGSNYFTKLDLKSGYYQVRMHSNDIHKTAFKIS